MLFWALAELSPGSRVCAGQRGIGCQQEASHQNGVVHQRAGEDLETACIGNEGGGLREVPQAGEQYLSHFCNASADYDPIGESQRQHVGESQRKGPGHPVQLRTAERIVGSGAFCQIRAGPPAGKCGQRRICRHIAGRVEPFFNERTGTQIFQPRGLTAAGRLPVGDPGIAQGAGTVSAGPVQTAADAGTDIGIEEAAAAAARAAVQLAQTAGDGIVADHSGQAEGLTEPFQQMEVFPALYLKRTDDRSGEGVDGAAEANADALDVVRLTER